MFTSFSAWALDFLSKAAGHKYIRRIPYTSGGKLRYRYIYKVTHTAGGKHALHEDDVAVGAAFMLGTDKGGEVHAHVKSVDGDKVTVEYDDGPRKGEKETMSKRDLLSKLDAAHGISQALQGEREKQAKVVADLKARGASDKQVAREQARLERLSASAPAPKSEEPKREERPTYDAEYIEKQHGAARAALEARDQDALEKILAQTYVGPLSPNLEMHRNLLETAAEDAAEMVQLFNLKRASAARLAYSSLGEKIKERARDAATNMLRNTPLRGMLGTTERVGAGRTTPAEFEGTLGKSSQVGPILQGYANLGSTSLVRDRENLTDADIARWADKILAQRVNMVTEKLQQNAAEQEKNLAYVQNADTMQEYIDYAVSTGVLADRGSAPSIYRDAGAFRKGAPAVVAALSRSVADTKSKLSDTEQLKRDVFAEIKEQTNANRPNPVYMNRVIDRLLEAMQAAL